jgi:hypothetical protein
MPHSYAHAGEWVEAALFGPMWLVARQESEPHAQARLPFPVAVEPQTR